MHVCTSSSADTRAISFVFSVVSLAFVVSKSATLASILRRAHSKVLWPGHAGIATLAVKKMQRIIDRMDLPKSICTCADTCAEEGKFQLRSVAASHN